MQPYNEIDARLKRAAFCTVLDLNHIDALKSCAYHAKTFADACEKAQTLIEQCIKPRDDVNNIVIFVFDAKGENILQIDHLEDKDGHINVHFSFEIPDAHRCANDLPDNVIRLFGN